MEHFTLILAGVAAFSLLLTVGSKIVPSSNGRYKTHPHYPKEIYSAEAD